MAERTKLQIEALAIFRDIGTVDSRVVYLVADAVGDEITYLNKAGKALMDAQWAIEILLHPDDSPNEDDESGKVGG